MRALIRMRGARLAVAASVALLAAALSETLLDGSARRQVTTAAAFYGGLALTWILVTGWLGRELRSGAVLLWEQLPASIVAMYALRFTMAMAMALLLASLLIGAVSLLVYQATPADAVLLLTGLPGVLLVHMVLGALVWTLGGWSVPGDGWAALVLALALAILELVARLRPNWLGPAAAPLDTVALPLDDIGLAASLLSGPSTGAVRALARVLTWLAGCVALGALGVGVRLSRPPTGDRS